MPASPMEALNKAILAFSAHGKQKAWFLLSFISNGLAPLEMAAHPCTTGTAE